ncbi:hypothetical protein Pla108_22900 [Botrimarina colliarenosi]|uniref:Uncharacterized protein n=1 Tax=Botrimarina colliarenosi TaxID=2528001 RepID=A0A5C6AIR8_9BACT|nr:hypothetical protein Pla108_22900 [Botrimarina colliarenosi]
MAKPSKPSNGAGASAAAATAVRGNMEVVPVRKQVVDEVARILRSRGFSGYSGTQGRTSK